MTREIWFTSDTHFAHSNIIRYSNRPFKSSEEMDEALIQNWNSRVNPGDTIYHLGDFTFSKADPAEYLRRLNGDKHLIWGNHDRTPTKKATGWASSRAYVEVQVKDINLCLFHYGLRVWNRSHHGALHLYGHSHGSLPGDSQSMDVGVDCCNYFPVNLEEIQAKLKMMANRQSVDHHKSNRSEDS